MKTKNIINTKLQMWIKNKRLEVGNETKSKFKIIKLINNRKYKWSY